MIFGEFDEALQETVGLDGRPDASSPGVIWVPAAALPSDARSPRLAHQRHDRLHDHPPDGEREERRRARKATSWRGRWTSRRGASVLARHPVAGSEHAAHRVAMPFVLLVTQDGLLTDLWSMPTVYAQARRLTAALTPRLWQGMAFEPDEVLHFLCSRPDARHSPAGRGDACAVSATSWTGCPDGAI